MWRDYWGVLADEPPWIKLLAWAVKPGIPLAIIVFGAWLAFR